MEDVTIKEAKDRLEELIARAAGGEDVVFRDSAYGSVHLTTTRTGPSRSHPFPKRIPGLMKNKVQISDDELFAPLSEDELAWLAGETSS